ncbi:MAG TPA: hypothetical protein VKZ53_30060 [Candidatus Angelobacter sp.]|nr:hypothetical protein [Candidatus Angelobacter sp.]
MLFAVAMLPRALKGQTLSPVDISAFGRDHPIQAVVTHISTSECKGAFDFKNGAMRHDDQAYDVHVSASLIFRNQSSEPVLLYKGFFPLTQRVAASVKDIALGKFVTGFDGDRTAVGGKPQKVSIDDFTVMKPGQSYTAAIHTMLFASVNGKKTLRTPGLYWIQLGIDARPDEFFFAVDIEKDFKKQWKAIGHVVDFLLAEPFSVKIALDPNAAACEE